MKNRFTILSIAPLVLIAVGCGSAAAEECDEYITRPPKCQVNIDMSNAMTAVPVHSDVQIKSGGLAEVVLKNASPFLACTIAAIPAAPARDLSTNIAAALTTLGGLVFPTVLPTPAAQAKALPPPGDAALDHIEAETTTLFDSEKLAFSALTNGLYKPLNTTLSANWVYSFPNDEAVDEAVKCLTGDLTTLLNESAPDLVTLQVQAKRVQDDLAQFYTDFHPAPGTPLAVRAAQDDGYVSSAVENVRLIQGAVLDFKKKVKSLADFVAGISTATTSDKPGGKAPDKSVITIAMAAYRQKSVTETITCKDALNSSNQPFDNIIFTAYYENTPIFDISPGVIISSLPGRQVGTVSGPLAPGPANATTTIPASGACGAYNPSETCLGITSATRPQFMPAAFFELHPINKKCPWAVNGAQRHPFGYVCSLGLVGGFSVNPNNGTASAEFFEGVSVGIQRLSIMFGIHNGRYQTFTDGYFVGEAVPAGTVARTERNWTNHFAIGIAYRTVLR